MKINHEIVLEISEKTECPILELDEPDNRGYWFVIFDEYIVINGEDQVVHLDEVMEELDKYDNIEYFTNEVYIDENQEETYYEQVSFQWKE